MADEAVGDWVGTEWQLTQTVFDRHTLVGGLDYRENLTQEQRTYYEEPELETMHLEKSGRNVGLYGQAEIAVRTNITLNAGLRYRLLRFVRGDTQSTAGLDLFAVEAHQLQAPLRTGFSYAQRVRALL